MQIKELHDKFKFIGTLNRFCDHLNYHHMEVIITNVIFLLIFVVLGYRTFDVFSSSMRLLISLVQLREKVSQDTVVLRQSITGKFSIMNRVDKINRPL